MNFTAIDFETANRKRSSACSIGMAKVRDGKVVDTYYDLIYPEPFGFEIMNILVHGITEDMVDGCPTLLDAWPGIEDFIDGDVLVAHNYTFERSVISNYMEFKQMPLPEFQYLCTLYMSKLNYPRRQSYGLEELCNDILQKPFSHHNALEDAVACAELAIHNIGLFREQDPSELVKVLFRPKTVKKKNLSLIEPTLDTNLNHSFFNKIVVFTGILSSMTREEAVVLLINCGGKYNNTVTMKTDYLVMGDQDYQHQLYGGNSTKTQKVEAMNAKGANIVIIGEQEFLKIVQSR